MQPTLFIMLPIDVAQPLVIPRPKKEHAFVDSGTNGTQSSRCLVRSWKNHILAELLGPERIVAVRSEAHESLSDDPKYERINFPWGVNGILGPALHLFGRGGGLIDSLKAEISEAGKVQGIDVQDGPAAATALLSCREWRVVIEAFTCGIAYVRLEIELLPDALDAVVDVAALVEAVVYGDLKPASDPANSPKSGRRIDLFNRKLRKLHSFLLENYRDETAGESLIRKMIWPLPAFGINIPWTQNLLLTESSTSLPTSLLEFIKMREGRFSHSSGAVDVTADGVSFRDDGWLITAQIMTLEQRLRLRFLVTIADVAGIVANILSHDIDARLADALTGQDERDHEPDEIRNIRLQAQIIVGQTDTLRISAYDLDQVIVASRGRLNNLDAYRAHISAAVETLYTLEVAATSFAEATMANMYAAAILAISVLTAISVAISIKDVPAFVEEAGPVVHGNVFQVHTAIDAAILVLLVVIVTFVVWRLVRARISAGRSKKQKTRTRLLRRVPGLRRVRRREGV